MNKCFRSSPHKRHPQLVLGRFVRDRGASRGADAARLYGLDTQHDPWRASTLACRTGGDDELDGLFEFGDPLLALWQPASG
jgi:hypothetical protein